MHLYRWRARSRSGKVYSGSYLAESKEEVAIFLRSNYGYATSIEEKITLTDKIIFSLSKGKVNDRQYSRFFLQLATMLDSGIPLCRALDLLKNRCPRSLAEICSALVSELKAGKSLSASMQKLGGAFAPVVFAVVEAGEEGGVLQEMLSELAVYYRQRSETSRFLKNICLYPCFVLLLTAATFILFIVKLLPLFADLYQSFNVLPSLPLQMLLMLRSFAGEYWQTTLFLASGYFYFLGHHRRKMLEWLYTFPVISIYRQMFLEIRFCKVLSLLLSSGLALPIAIETAAATTADKNTISRAKLFAETIIKGSDVTKAAAIASPLLSSLTIEFLLVGENSGSLAQMLREASQILEHDFTAALNNMKALLEPVLLVVLAIAVAAMIFMVAGPLLTLLTEMPEYE